METIFVHVDVETTGSDPLTGSLLSIACVAVLESAPDEVISHLYRRCKLSKPFSYDSETLSWWVDQDVRVHHEAFVPGADRLAPLRLFQDLEAWLHTIVGVGALLSGQECVVVPVADPGAFDRKWFDFALLGRRLPYVSHRTLCLRSMQYGIDRMGFNESRSERTTYTEPEFPHHPLSDALSQASFLATILVGQPLKGTPTITFLGEQE